MQIDYDLFTVNIIIASKKKKLLSEEHLTKVYFPFLLSFNVENVDLWYSMHQNASYLYLKDFLLHINEEV